MTTDLSGQPRPAGPPAGLVAALRRAVRGRVVYPADPAWAPLVTDEPPGVVAVVVAADEADVVVAVAAAGCHGLGVRAHPAAAPAAPAAPALLLLLHRLDAVRPAAPGQVSAQVGASRGELADRAEAEVVLGHRVVRTDGFAHDVDGPTPGPGVVVARTHPARPTTSPTTTTRRTP